jgi:hypothetical protein
MLIFRIALLGFLLVATFGLHVFFGATANAFLTIAVEIMILVATVFLMAKCRCCDQATKPRSHEQEVLLQQPLDSEIQSTPKHSPQRMFYMDNIKVALTVIVICHHVTCAFLGPSWYYTISTDSATESLEFSIFASGFLGLNQSYFMALFFFISAYFSPSSLDRKGTYGFLRDKFKRLGIPHLLYTVAAGPALSYFISTLHTGSSGYSYFLGAGHTWFLAWLLIFNSCYCLFTPYPSITCPRPSLLVLMAASVVIGAVQGGILILGVGMFILYRSLGYIYFVISFTLLSFPSLEILVLNICACLSASLLLILFLLSFLS